MCLISGEMTLHAWTLASLYVCVVSQIPIFFEVPSRTNFFLGRKLRQKKICLLVISSQTKEFQTTRPSCPSCPSKISIFLPFFLFFLSIGIDSIYYMYIAYVYNVYICYIINVSWVDKFYFFLDYYFFTRTTRTDI